MNNAHEDEPKFLVRTKSLRGILSDLRKAELWLAAAAFAAFLASSFFVVKYFVGGEMTPSLWDGEQWFNAFLGLGITAVITAAQAFLYATGKKGAAAGIGVFIVVFFGFFSEVSQSMERADITVRQRSQDSEVFKATLGSITVLSSVPSISGAASSELARAQQKATEIQTRIDNKNKCKSCESESFRNLRTALAKAEGRVAAAKSRADLEVQSASSANAAALQSAINTAKSLEYDEDKHYAMIRLIKSLFGVTADWASFLFSMIIIVSFEYSFFYVGRYVSSHKQSLVLLGRDEKGRRVDSSPERSTETEDTGIPTDHGTNLREEYLDWVTPERAEPASRDAENANGDAGHRDLYLSVLQAIKDGDIREIQTRRDKPLFKFVKSQVGGSNAQIEAQVRGLIDNWLAPEGIIKPNPDKSRNTPAWIIDRSIIDPASPGTQTYDFTQKRFFKLIYTEVRNLILNGDIKPSVRPVTDAVTTIIRHKSHLLGIKPSMMGKPQRQQIAQSILEHLERETVVTRNKEGGAGKPSYVLAPTYMGALQAR